MAKKKFPDLDGDGKTSFKDILIGRGVIKKKKAAKKKVAKKKVAKKKVAKKKTKRR